MIIVEKFGGTSLSGVPEVRRAASLIARAAREGNRVAAVLSAQGGTTDELLRTAVEYNPNPSARELDMLLSTGEQASVALMAMTLEDMGLPVVSLTGWQAGLGTDGAHGNARLRRLAPTRIRGELEEGRIVLIAGFQGLSPRGDITTLGRGGSDTTAVAVAAALRADECRIYTDVEGVFTADPRLVPSARRLPEVDSQEMHVLASMGARVLHERAAELASRFSVPVSIRSTFSESPGTAIRPLPLGEEEWRLTAVAESGGLLSLVGGNLHLRPELGETAKAALETEGIHLRSYLQTPRRFTGELTDSDRRVDALRCLHKAFFE